MDAYNNAYMLLALSAMADMTVSVSLSLSLSPLCHLLLRIETLRSYSLAYRPT